MTSAEEHKKNFEQFMSDINEKIRAGLLLERQKIIAFDTSEAATNLIEYFLHKKNLIPLGFKINHNYFSSEKRANRYLDFDFPDKNNILKLMTKQEELRNLLCYGKEKSKEKVQETITNLHKIIKLIEENLGEKI